MNEKSNKLISLMKGLDRAQRRSCRKLVQSPYFGGNDDLLAFYDEIGKRLDRDRSLDKREIWASVRGKSQAFNDVRFRKYTSDLFKLVREFLVQDTLREEPDLHRYLYLASLEKQQPEKLVRGVERNWEAHVNPGEFSRYSSDAYLYRYLLEHRKYALLNYNHRPYTRSNVEEVNHYLDAYFIITKLQYAFLVISRFQNERHRYELQLLPEIVAYLDQNPRYLDIPIIALLKGVYDLLSGETEADNDDEVYYNYKALLLSYADELNEDTAYEFFQAALNYCRRRVNTGGTDWAREHTTVYQFALERNFVFDDGILDPLQFRNTILLALRSGEFAWTEAFIQDYQDRLPPKQRQNAVTYNLATLYFYQKDYDRTQTLLHQVEYENVTYNLNSKVMLLAVYYETGQFGILDSLFDAISAYLNRHKELPESARRAFGNLVSFTRRLTRLTRGDTRGLEQLKEDLASKKYVASLPWLQEKIAEF